MGIGDFFSKYKADRDKKALLKNIRRLIHQDLQHEDRLRAAEYLAEVGTHEALYGLLRRYDMSLEKGYMDQDEKVFVHDTMVGKGVDAIDAIESFLKTSENVSWPERILSSILKDDTKVVDVLIRVIDHEREVGNDMKATKRANLLDLFTRYQDPRISTAVLPFLGDFDETVRITCVSVLDHQGSEVAIEPLAKLMVSDEEESFRVRGRVAECFINHDWLVPDAYRGALAERLPPGVSLDKKGQLSR